MTKEELMKLQTYKLFENEENVYVDRNDVLELLEREPRWVLYEGDGYADGKMAYDMATCPNCGHEFDESDSNWQEACFCPNCGQALRWE